MFGRVQGFIDTLGQHIGGLHRFELRHPPLQELPLGVVADQIQRLSVRVCGFGVPAQPTQKVGPESSLMR